jgi:hypothetical protein
VFGKKHFLVDLKKIYFDSLRSQLFIPASFAISIRVAYGWRSGMHIKCLISRSFSA